RLAGRRGGRSQPGEARPGYARKHSGQLSRNGASISGLPGQRALFDSGGARDHLHRPGRPVRKLHSPDHDSLHPALGWSRRAARPVGNFYHRRTDLQPAAHAIYDTGVLSGVRSPGQAFEQGTCQTARAAITIGALLVNISAPFIRRPVATTLLTIAVGLAGA